MAKLHRDNAGYIGCSHEETQDPYYSYNKLSLPLSGATESVQRPAEVTHTVTVAGGKFVIGGVSQATLSLIEGGTYKFDQSDSSNVTHPFKFSQTSNGTWNRGTEYTKGVTYVGTPGSSGAYTQLVVPFGGLDLYYYCGNHTGMGGSASTPANAGMFTAALPILKTADQFGASAPTGGSAVLVEGDPSSSTSNPFGSGNGYSIEFDGNDRLKILGGTIVGDFTYECWFNMDSGTSGYRRILSTNEPLYSSEQTMIRLHTNGNIQFYAGNGTPEQQGGTGSTSTWYHAAIVRSGDTISYYIDGSRQGTDTYSASNDIPLTQVCLAWGYGSEYFTGKISNVRVSNNARYTGVSHTVPTSTFSSDSNTLLLAAHTNSLTTVQGTWASPASGWPGTEDTAPDPYAANLVLALPMNGSNNGTTFADQSAAIKGSGSAKAITRTNAVTSTAQSIYYGSSGYFDGSGDSLSTPNSSDFDFGTGDFTIEQWVYQTEQTSGQYYVISAKYSSSPHSWWWAIHGNYSRFFFYSSTLSSNFGTSSTTVPLNTWTHLAVTRKNGILRMLQDGVVTHAMLWPDSMYSSSHAVTIGEDADGNYDFKGYISDTRIYKGVAKYQPEGSGSLGMDVLTYSGNGGTQSISSLAFQPDLVWIKSLNSADSHHLYDSQRGTARLAPANPNGEYDNSDFQSIDASGFTLKNGKNQTNGTGKDYVAWCWKANGAATTIAAGSLNSSVYNQSAVWSGMCSPSPSSGTFASGFDGSLTTTFAGGISAGAYFTFTPTGGISFSNNIRVYNGAVANASYKYNGGSATSFPTNSWTTVASGGGTMTTFAVTRGETDVHGWYAIEVDGKILVDYGATPATNVPSIASSCSANTDYGFSITSFTGTGTNGSVGHGLTGQTPKFVIIKNRDNALNWVVGHASEGFDKILVLNENYMAGDTSQTGAQTQYFNDTAPTTSSFSVGTAAGTNRSPERYIAYCWSEIAGFSKFGSYSGGTNPRTITTGFKPKYLLIKSSSHSSHWQIIDSVRGGTQKLAADIDVVENDSSTLGGTSINTVEFLEDGFKLTTANTGTNQSGYTYIYAAFAESAPGDPGQDAFKFLETLNTQDQSSSAHTVTNNGASFQTSVQKFYGGAAEFDSSYLTIPATSDFNFSSGDFTMECWFNQQTNASMALTDFVGQSSGTAPYGQWYYSTSNGLGWYHASTTYAASGQPWNLNSWVHAALVRNGNTLTTYINGSQSGSSAFTRSDAGTSTLDLRIGLQGNTYWDGFIQDFRIYKGIAKYTSSFSPPERSVQGTARRYPSGIYVVS